jgi:hypothetical protein
MSSVERSSVLVSSVSPVKVLPLTAPSRSPGCGLPTLSLGTYIVIVPFASNLPSMLPSFVSVGTPTTSPTTAVATWPYSKLTAPFESLRMPT